MNRNASVAVLMAALLAGQPMAAAASRPIELKWTELGPHIQGHDVELALPDGAVVKGEVEAVREDALVLNIRKTSNPKAHPEGNAVLPRTSVKDLSLRESRGRWGRSVGVALGSLTGVTLGGYTAVTTANSDAQGLATFLVITGAGTLAGYFLGKAADSRFKHIRVVQ